MSQIVSWKVIKSIIIILISFCSIFLVKYIYHRHNPLYFWFPDTYQYLNRGQAIARGEPIIHFYRTPLYPLLLKYLLPLSGYPEVNIQTINYFNYQKVVKFQSDYGIIGAIAFLFLACFTFNINIKLLIICLLFAFNIRIFAWEKNILTESITLNTILILVCFLVLFLKSKNVFYLLCSYLFSIILFLIRPVFFSLPITLAPFFVYYMRKKKIYFQSQIAILMCILFLIIPFYYSLQNKRLYGYFGLTNIIQQDLLAKTIQYRLDGKNIDFDSVYSSHFNDCIQQHVQGTWIGTDDCLSTLNLPNDAWFLHSATIAGSFAKKLIMKHPWEFLLKTIMILPQVLIDNRPDPFYWISTYANIPSLENFWEKINNFYIFIHQFTLAFYLFYPFSLYRFIRQPSSKNAIIITLGNIVAYQIILNAFFTQSDYIRLRSPILPELYLFCFYYYLLFFSEIKMIISANFPINKSRLNKNK